MGPQWVRREKLFPQRIVHKIFETSYGFHVI